MDFETAFAHYQSNTATAEETALVERELAKYQLIEDYFAAQELPELPEDTALAASETKAVLAGAISGCLNSTISGICKKKRNVTAHREKSFA